MQPLFHAADLALVRERSAYGVGEIVTYRNWKSAASSSTGSSPPHLRRGEPGVRYRDTPGTTVR